MKWNNVGDQNCPVARTLSVVGDRWTLLILRNAFMGIRRFEDFYTGLGVTRHVLAARLVRLVRLGIFDKISYQERPPRFEYRLTNKGRELHDLILVMAGWGERWMSTEESNPLQYRHLNCGHRFQPVLVCSECTEPIKLKNVRVELNSTTAQ